ncbi:hypothetical protein B0H15DRAFT_956204 [Mycena belliarum]|uniref:Uncharacterized protein n=1 Tax=Mycena belliarum TaxID=1033014 RepID=A0AAD6XFF7_9AGAR|nr:hypothetical protein B0H15DRAFT_956204 [Mycena belliae]
MTDYSQVSAPAAPAPAGAVAPVVVPPPTLPAPSAAPPPSVNDLAHELAAMKIALTAVNNSAAAFKAATVSFETSLATLDTMVAALLAPQPPVAPTPAHIGMVGPWVAGRLYGVVPQAHLTPALDASPADKWYAITRGTYVGLTRNSAVSLHAVTGISTALSDRFTSQAEALDHFNTALDLGAIAIIQ